VRRSVVMYTYRREVLRLLFPGNRVNTGLTSRACYQYTPVTGHGLSGAES